MSRLRRVRSQVGYLLHRLRCQHTHWTVERTDGTARFAMFGHPRAASHFARYYLDDRDARHGPRQWHGRDFTRLARRRAENTGLAVLCQIHSPLALAADLLTLPSLVELEAALPPTLALMTGQLSDSARQDVRRIRIEGYRSEITRDPGVIPEFYRRYHEPSMRRRHGDDSYTFSAENLRASLASGDTELMQVFLGEEWVAGCLCQPHPDGYRMLRAGWRDGSDALLKKSILGALYWFSIQRAYALGLPQLRAGAAPPYLDDGLFYYKSKWGGRLDWARSRYDSWQLLLNPAHPQCRQYLATHALLVKSPDGKFIVLSGRGPDEIKEAKTQQRTISTWFKLREIPGSPSSSPLPARLAAWFDEIRLEP